MTRAFRYTAAAICFAACSFSLGLWWRSYVRSDRLTIPSDFFHNRHTTVSSSYGRIIVTMVPTEITANRGLSHLGWGHEQILGVGLRSQMYGHESKTYTACFGKRRHGVYFPIWYPTLVFALAAYGAIRLGRFTLRSILVAMTAIAGLLAMIVVF